MANFQDFLNGRECNPFSDPKYFEKIDRAKSFSRKRRNRNVAMIIASAAMLWHGVHGMMVAGQLGQSFNAWSQQRQASAAKQAEQQRLAATQAQKDRLAGQQLATAKRILERYEHSKDFSHARAAVLDLDIATATDNSTYSPAALSGRRYIPNTKMINAADISSQDNIKIVAEQDGRLSIVFEPISQPVPAHTMPAASTMLPFQVASLSGNRGR